MLSLLPTRTILVLLAVIAVIGVLAFGNNQPRAPVHTELAYATGPHAPPAPAGCPSPDGCPMQAHGHD